MGYGDAVFSEKKCSARSCDSSRGRSISIFIERRRRRTGPVVAIGAKSAGSSFNGNMGNFWKLLTNAVGVRGLFPKQCRRVPGAASAEPLLGGYHFPCRVSSLPEGYETRLVLLRLVLRSGIRARFESGIHRCEVPGSVQQC